jgi:hypothetical protein
VRGSACAGGDAEEEMSAQLDRGRAGGQQHSLHLL